MFPYFLKEDEQLLVESLTKRYTLNGPGWFNIGLFESVRRRKAVTLGTTEYLRVRNTLTGEIRNEIGPKLFFGSASDEVIERLSAIPLKKNQYVRILDTSTGMIRVEKGEATIYLAPTEKTPEKIEIGINVDDRVTVLVRDIVGGQLSLITEKQVFIPSPNQEVVEVRKRISLKKNQYVRVIDKRTGEVRVERGEQNIFLGMYEELLEQIQEGINVDEHTAVLVRDIASGQLSLIIEPQVFIPSPTQELVDVRQRVLLEDHEAVVIKDKEGKYIIRYGTDAKRSFFLEPYSELVTFCWSTGIHKDQCTLKITHVDTRPKFMWYEFEARTQDNVELMIGITFFWQILDAGAMVKTTDDAPGDVCSHARSTIIQAVSQVPLEKFLAGFNMIVRDGVLGGNMSFYEQRGVKIHAVEVRNVSCKDAATQKILQEIIQETTNRLNRLQKQESENEVAVEKVRGEITAEEMKSKLIDMQREHARTRGLMEGEAEAIRVKAFLDGLGEVAAADKIAIFNTLRKQDALESLSTGNAQMYFTPNDVDLRIETRS